MKNIALFLTIWLLAKFFLCAQTSINEYSSYLFNDIIRIDGGYLATGGEFKILRTDEMVIQFGKKLIHYH
jgi:hypothetical protein